MKIITYCKTIELDVCHQIKFDHDKAMITFFLVGVTERLYFGNKERAIEFMQEIIEGIYCSSPLVDVSHITAIPEELPIIPFKDEVQERINNYKPSEDENYM